MALTERLKQDPIKISTRFLRSVNFPETVKTDVLGYNNRVLLLSEGGNKFFDLFTGKSFREIPREATTEVGTVDGIDVILLGDNRTLYDLESQEEFAYLPQEVDSLHFVTTRVRGHDICLGKDHQTLIDAKRGKVIKKLRHPIWGKVTYIKRDNQYIAPSTDQHSFIDIETDKVFSRMRRTVTSQVTRYKRDYLVVGTMDRLMNVRTGEYEYVFGGGINGSIINPNGRGLVMGFDWGMFYDINEQDIAFKLPDKLMVVYYDEDLGWIGLKMCGDKLYNLSNGKLICELRSPISSPFYRKNGKGPYFALEWHTSFVMDGKNHINSVEAYSFRKYVRKKK